LRDGTTQRQGTAFAALHGRPFIIPNPWDAGSARALAGLGFKALATTGSGFAFTLGRPDGARRSTDVAHHVRELVGVTDLPVSVDLENGYGLNPRLRPGDRAAAEAERVGGFDRGL
jgi:2-methylisocitrate lyase-like PEP mutase family enzyme